jgi:biopolymer transport protein ExbD
MSHGPAAEGSSAEPNLTPLLDMVLQLLMFFMMCVNFVNDQIKEDVKLPDSTQARPMDKAETDVLFVNLRPFNPADYRDRLPADALARLERKFKEGDACVSVVGMEPMKLLELKFWLKQRYEDEEKSARGGKVNTAIILRAHKDADYGQVFQVLQMCKVVGYRKLKLRATSKSGGGA